MFSLKSIRATGLVVCIFFFTVSGLVAQDEARISTLLGEADALIASNNLQGAMEKTTQALAISPDNTNALQKQINIYFLLEDEKESLSLADKAIRLHPEVPDFYYLRGIINNRKNEALDDFNNAINLQTSGNQYRYYLGRGVAHLNLLEYEQALADFTTSIELNDTVASAYHSRAMANYEMKDYAGAVSDFLKTLDYSEGNAALYFNLGMSYFRMEEKDKACPFHKSVPGYTNACRMALIDVSSYRRSRKESSESYSLLLLPAKFC
jgi:tetratricopeptide (TPR) repeat protein